MKKTYLGKSQRHSLYLATGTGTTVQLEDRQFLPPCYLQRVNYHTAILITTTQLSGPMLRDKNNVERSAWSDQNEGLENVGLENDGLENDRPQIPLYCTS